MDIHGLIWEHLERGVTDRAHPVAPVPVEHSTPEEDWRSSLPPTRRM